MTGRRRKNLLPEALQAMAPAGAMAGAELIKGRVKKRPLKVREVQAFTTADEWDERFGGPKQGTITVDYDTLVELFGDPVPTKPNGIDLEWWPEVTWYIVFEDGSTAMIYDWQLTGPVGENTRWTVAGNGGAFENVVAVLGLPANAIEDQRIAFRQSRTSNRVRSLARRLRRR